MKLKKIVVLALALAMALSLVACGGEEAPETKDADVAVSEEMEEEIEEDVEELEGAEDPVSDESWELLQESFAVLCQSFDQVNELYQNDAIAADEDINTALEESQALIGEMAAIEREGMTEGEALDLGNAMVEFIEFFGEIVDSMEVA